MRRIRCHGVDGGLSRQFRKPLDGAICRRAAFSTRRRFELVRAAVPEITSPTSHNSVDLRLPLGGDMRKLAAALLFVATFATTANAQEVTTALSISSVGSGAGHGPYPSVEFRASLPTSDRFAVESFVTVGSQQRPVRGLEGFYGVQIRQRIAHLTTRESYVFATYGLSAYYSSSGTEAPVIGQLGFGVRHRTSRYLAFRSEIDVLTWIYYPVGARFTVGLSLAKD